MPVFFLTALLIKCKCGENSYFQYEIVHQSRGFPNIRKVILLIVLSKLYKS